MCIAICSACTKLQSEPLRQHIRDALAAGATRAAILELLKCAAMLAIHSCSLGAPILLEEAANFGQTSTDAAEAPPTPYCDQMRHMGQWNTAWDPFFNLDPGWTDQFFAAGADVSSGGVFTPKFLELLSIAYDASITHMYAPGTRRHIRSALALGASTAEVMEVLKLCVSFGAASLRPGVPILHEELG